MNNSKGTNDALIAIGAQAKIAARKLALLSTDKKNGALSAIARSLKNNQEAIFEANNADCDRAKSLSLSSGTIDRLRISSNVLGGMIQGIQKLIELPDPIGEQLSERQIQSGLSVRKIRVPLGVIGIIYESRPNVTVDTACLTLKSGNAVILRGSSNALHSNRALSGIMREAIAASGFDENCVQLIDDASRETIDAFLRMRGYVDAMVPRGGAELIRYVTENSRVPVIETGAGICHVYVHGDAEYSMAEKIVLNAKTQRPSVCNSIETLLISKDWPKENTGKLIEALLKANVEVRGCDRSVTLHSKVIHASQDDWATEYQDLIISLKIVSSLEDALEHIQTHGTAHSESIITKDKSVADIFLSTVDAAAVYHNASTRFTDGFEFGFGAELGISTQKLHCRGPIGLLELTSYKYVVLGDGHTRK